MRFLPFLLILFTLPARGAVEICGKVYKASASVYYFEAGLDSCRRIIAIPLNEDSEELFPQNVVERKGLCLSGNRGVGVYGQTGHPSVEGVICPFYATRARAK